jgi:hypothetical protein
MKNFLQILLIASLFIGCSSSNDDDLTTEDTTPLLVTKQNYLSADGTYDGSMNYSYDGDKIVKMETSDGEEKVEFTYKGDEISKSVTYLNNQIREINEFLYTNGKLTSQKVTESYSAHTYNFTINYDYVNDNYVKYTRVTGYSTNSSGVITYSTTNYEAFISNGNLNKIISKSTSSGTTTYNYTYDDKNNPYKNIRGYAKAMIFDTTNSDLSSINNLTKRTYNQSLLNTEYSGTITKAITYTGNNFPSKIVTVEKNNNLPTQSYIDTFEYNK